MCAVAKGHAQLPCVLGVLGAGTQRPTTHGTPPLLPAPTPQRTCISDPGNAPAATVAAADALAAAAAVDQARQNAEALIWTGPLNGNPRRLPWASGEATIDSTKRVNTAGGVNGAPERTVDCAVVTLTGSAAFAAAAVGAGQACVLPDGRTVVRMLSAVKTVTATLPEFESLLLRSCCATDLSLLPTVKQMAQELEAYDKTTQRAVDVHGAPMAQHCFLQLYGWQLLYIGGDTYVLRSYWEWQSNGSLRDYLIRCLEHTNHGVGRALVVSALEEVLQLLHMLSCSGIVLGDLKLDNMLVDAHGRVKLSDVDGAGLVDADVMRIVRDTALRAAAQAAAACLDPGAAAAAVWHAADQLFCQEKPYMVTDAYVPFEMRVYGRMCCASHQHLLGASLGQLLGELQPVLLALPGRVACWGFVTELRGLAAGLQTPAHTARPSLHSVCAHLTAIGARWAAVCC
ncbi:hypothetical protein HXX76_002443 [Chlamydomonas incerta]|uniref:Protein kinase domain-containing protein n=1 Tax=Chlamydomonas incerta TaxID=51695 RepID=A0A835TBC3_CHLIN|nr:hypothetical protein HXX76_002443 [Chlamydomonas incerta]|eukprot:KAG2442357.1 hypothetical protein HXX76_002443 [Chlamydomonas incerta]